MAQQIEINVADFLKSYSICSTFLRSQDYSKEYFDPYDTQKREKVILYTARLEAIESLISLLEPSAEYTLLHLHYIKGVPVEKCAESMCISRRTAFRMLKRAREYLYELINKKGE